MIFVYLMFVCCLIIVLCGGVMLGLELYNIVVFVICVCLVDVGIGVEDVDELIVLNVFGVGGNFVWMVVLVVGLLECVVGLSVD